MLDALGVGGFFRPAAEKADAESIGSLRRKQFSRRRIGFNHTGPSLVSMAIFNLFLGSDLLMPPCLGDFRVPKTQGFLPIEPFQA